MMRSDGVTREGENGFHPGGQRRTVEDIFRRGLWILGVMTVAGEVIWGWRIAVSILLGGVMACLNFHWLKLAMDRVLTGHSRHSPTILMMGFLGRLLLILVGLFAIIQLSFLSLFGAVGGMAIFVVAGFLEAILLLMRK